MNKPITDSEINIYIQLSSIKKRPNMYWDGKDPRTFLSELVSAAATYAETTIYTKITDNHYNIRVEGFKKLDISKDSLEHIVYDCYLGMACGSMPIATPVLAIAFSKRIVLDFFLLGKRNIFEEGTLVSVEEISLIPGEININVYY